MYVEALTEDDKVVRIAMAPGNKLEVTILNQE